MITKNSDGSYTVSSRSKPGQQWIVNPDMNSCNCPKFIYILKRASHCHHIEEVRRTQLQKPIIGFPIFNPDKYTTLLTLDKFIEQYGDEQYEQLITVQNIILHKNFVRILK